MGSEESKKSQRGTFSAEDISMFCAQLTLTLRAGISLYDGVCAINENVKNPKAHKILKSMEEDLEINKPFYEALRNAGAFPDYMVNMVEIGEKSGNLEAVIDSMSVYYERDDKLKKNIKSAVLYPSILVVMMSAVIAVLVMEVLPIFTQVFESLGGELSSSSTVVMNIGIAVAKYAFIVILAIAAIGLIIFIYTKTSKGKGFFTRLMNHFYPARKFLDKLASARFASVMSMMLSSGFNTDEALEMSAKIITSKNMVNKIEACRKHIAAGESFTQALDKESLFAGIYHQMVSIGVKTGSLDNVMKKLADVYNEEVDNSISRAISLIEPCLVGILSVIIGAILLSVMLPLMGIMSSIG